MEQEKNPFLALLESGRPVLSDGAIGTVLHTRGISFDECFDELNLTKPGLVAEIHREYIEAGSQMIQTNTFGANRFKLARHGLEDQVEAINTAGVELARRVVWAAYKPVLIAGDVGPLGVRLAPFGRVKPEQAREAFSEQIGALVRANVDVLIIETMSDVVEINEAIQAAKAIAPNIPVLASMTFTRDDRTLLGRAAPDFTHTETNAGGGSGSAFIGHAERGLARTGGRAHHVSGWARLFWRLCPHLLESRYLRDRRLLRDHAAAYRRDFARLSDSAK
jgi:methionine synthase I (cobalamin-dependent)